MSEAREPAVVGRTRSVPDRVLGVIGAAMVLFALYLLVFGGPQEDATPTAPPPQLRLTSPGEGDSVSMPLQLRFTSEVPVAPQPGGWGAGGYHVHARVDGAEAMPGPTDIRRGEGGEYVWTLRGVRPGEREVRLFWSDQEHFAVEGSGSEAVSVFVR